MQLPNVPQLLTLGGLARRVDVPTMRLSRLVKAGRIAPDFVAGTTFLFQPGRLGEVEELIHPTTNTQS